MKKITALLLALIMIFSLCACSTPAADNSGDEQNAETRIFVDSAGREVEIPVNIEHIIPSGSLAQTFMWPLAANKIVSTNVEYTDEQLKYIGEQYKDLPVTGNLYQTGSELNIEEVAALNADIIVDFGEPKENITEDLDNLQNLLGIPCIFIEGSFTNSADAYRMLGDLLNMEDEAEQIALYIENIMDTTGDVFSRIDKKTVAFCNSSDGLGCIAEGTYFDEIWSYMAKNVVEVDDAQMYWFSTVNLEQLQTWDPEFIFFYSEDAYATAMNDPAWSELQAVKNNHCYTIPSQPIDFCFSPSINRYMGIMWLAELMYPDEFDWNIKDEVYNFYKVFYHCDMTDELYDELMNSAHNLPY